MQLVFRAHNKRLLGDPLFEYDSRAGDLIYVTYDGRFSADAPERKSFIVIDTPHNFWDLYRQDWRSIKALTIPRRLDKLPWEFYIKDGYDLAEKTVKHPYRIDLKNWVSQGFVNQAQYESMTDPSRMHTPIYLDRDFTSFLIDKLGNPTNDPLITLDGLPKKNWDTGDKYIASSGGDYTSWVTACDELGDLTGNAVIHGKNSEVITETDNILVDIDTDTHSLTIKGDVTHNGKYDGHRIDISFDYDRFTFDESTRNDTLNNVIIEDLAINADGGSHNYALYLPNGFFSTKAIIRRNVITCGAGGGMGIYCLYNATRLSIWNNIIYDAGVGIYFNDEYALTEWLVYNNTIVDCDIGIHWTSTTPGAGTKECKNNLIYHSGSPTACWLDDNGSNPTTACNVTSDGTSPDGATYQNWAGNAAFNNEAGNDFTLKDTDAVLDNAADPGTMADEDILQNARVTWYIGASEYDAGGENIEVSATLDELALTEYVAGINKEIDLTAGIDSLVLIEYAADINKEISFTTGVDELVLTEYATTVKLDISFTAGIDTLILTEYNPIVSVGANINVTATLDELVLVEYTANVNKEIGFTTGLDALTLAEYVAGINKEINFTAGVDPLVLTEYPAEIKKDISMTAGLNALTLTEYAAAVGLGLNVSASLDTLVLTEYSAEVKKDISITAGIDALTLTEYSAAVSLGANIEVSAGLDALVLTEYPAAVKIDLNIHTGIDTLVLTEYAANINSEINVGAGIDALVITENSVDISLGIAISAGVDTLALSTFAATVNAEINFTAGIDALILTEYAALVSLLFMVSEKRTLLINGENRVISINVENRVINTNVEDQTLLT